MLNVQRREGGVATDDLGDDEGDRSEVDIESQPCVRHRHLCEGQLLVLLDCENEGRKTVDTHVLAECHNIGTGLGVWHMKK